MWEVYWPHACCLLQKDSVQSVSQLQKVSELSYRCWMRHKDFIYTNIAEPRPHSQRFSCQLVMSACPIGQSGSGLSCCRDGNVIKQELRHPDCFPISLPQNDHMFGSFGERCMEFVRSLPAPRPECNFGPREQVQNVQFWQTRHSSTAVNYLDIPRHWLAWLTLQRGVTGGVTGTTHIVNSLPVVEWRAMPTSCIKHLNTL
jgi:hypothetical protein